MKNKAVFYRLAKNFSYLGLMRGLTLIIPLMTFPYLLQTLGANKYGLVMWAWSISNFFIILVKFGFDVTSTKKISVARNNIEKLSEIASKTFSAKLYLMLLCFFILIATIILSDKIFENRWLFSCFFILIIGEAFMPIWFFQGIEKMAYTAFAVSGVKIIFALLVFFTIKSEKEFLLVPVLYGISALVSGLLSYWVIFNKYKVKIKLYGFFSIIPYMKESAHLFLSSSITMIRDTANIVLIENYVGLEAVALVDITQKFINVLITPFHILATTILPYLSKTDDKKLFNNILIMSVLLSSILYLTMYIFSDQLALYLSNEKEDMISDILKILGITIIFAAVSVQFGMNKLVINGYEKEYLYSTIFGVLSYFLTIATLGRADIYVFLYAIVGSFFVELLFRLYYSNKIGVKI